MPKYTKKSKNERKNIIDKIYQKLSTDCKRCGEKLKINKEREDRVTCKNKLCKSKYNIYENTIFYCKKIEKMKISKVLELFMVKTSINTICYSTKLAKSTIWRILKDLQKHLVPVYYDSLDVIGGNDVIIQVDESKIGKRKYNRGHAVDGVWVLGMVEKTPARRIKMVVVKDRSAETLTNILQESVADNSLIYSDCWKGYNRCKDNFKDHKTVNHSKYFVDPITKVDTNTIEGEWSGLKVSVPFRGRTATKIPLYLVRYMILRNEKEHPLDAIIKYLF